MRNRDEKVDLLRELPLFAGAHRRELRQLAAATDLVSADAGRVLCRADRRALVTYIVVDGMVDVVVQGTTVALLRRGLIVGELGVIDGEPRSADAVATTDVTLLAIHASALRGLIEASHALRTALLRRLAARAHHGSRGRAPHRRVTVRLSVGVGVENSRDTCCHPPIRRQVEELARTAGIRARPRHPGNEERRAREAVTRAPC